MKVKHRTTPVLLWHHANIVQECESNLSHHGGASLWVGDDEWETLTNEQKTWLASKTQMDEWKHLAKLHRSILDMMGLDTNEYPFDKIGGYLSSGIV